MGHRTAELGSEIKRGMGHGKDRRNGGDSVGESVSGDGDSMGENGSGEKMETEKKKTTAQAEKRMAKTRK
jgi:hypothetical protein